MHTYASVAQLKDYLRDNGASEVDPAQDAFRLSRLESASRRVDEYCDRSAALAEGSWTGFGPRIGTNRYDGSGELSLRLGDDLVSIASITRADSTGGTPVALVADTDYYIQPYGGPPYRTIRLIELGLGPAWGLRIWAVAGTWGGPGYGTLQADCSVASGLAADATTRSFILSASPDVSPGNTLLIGSEQLYLSGLNGTTATVVRGANGTTAATHPDTSTISVYTYHTSVVEGSLQIATRRLRASQAGLSGAYGGGDVPDAPQRETEWSVLAGTVGGLHLVSIG